MKKILITFLIISLSSSFSFAEDGVINSIIENKNSAVREFKNFFKTDAKKEEVMERMDSVNVAEIKKEIKVDASDLKKSSTTSVLSTTTTPADQICENKIKILNKKEKINLQLKSQIKDKNKLTDKLLEISADSATSTKEIFDNKILKLETEVGEAIKIQKNILNLIASSTDNVCDPAAFTSIIVASDSKIRKEKMIAVKENKEYSNLSKAIKKLELENDKQLEKINKFIKTDIKNLLVETNKGE